MYWKNIKGEVDEDKIRREYDYRWDKLKATING
jgi:hypothetical protein